MITMFKAIADYGNDETVTKETRLVPAALVNADKIDYRVEQIEITQLSPLIELEGISRSSNRNRTTRSRDSSDKASTRS